MAPNRLGYLALALVFYSSVSQGDGNPVSNGDGNPVSTDNGISEFTFSGKKLSNGSWTVAFFLNEETKHIPEILMPRLYQNVSDKDNFTDTGEDNEEPTSVEIFSHARGEEKTSKEKLTEVGANTTFKIFSRKDWNATEEKLNLDVRSKPADFVVILEGRKYPCFTADECVEAMRVMEKNSSVGSNWFVGGDGNLYEGLGWDRSKNIDGGFARFSLRVSFLGDSASRPPSKSTVDSFKAFLKTSVSLGKLSPNYKIIPYVVLNGRHNIIGEGLREEMKNWERYSENVEFEPCKTFGRFPVIFREEWGAEKTNRSFGWTWKPLEYVVVMNEGLRCFNAETCLYTIREFQNKSSVDVKNNFYVGEDGFAYEGRGWDSSPATVIKRIRNRHVTISFLGRFRSYLPSNNAFVSFEKLLRFGVLIGKLSPRYEILSIRTFADDDAFLGDRLNEELKKMERYTDSIEKSWFE